MALQFLPIEILISVCSQVGDHHQDTKIKGKSCKELQELREEATLVVWVKYV